MKEARVKEARIMATPVRRSIAKLRIRDATTLERGG